MKFCELKTQVPPQLAWVVQTPGCGRLVLSSNLKLTQYVACVS